MVESLACIVGLSIAKRIVADEKDLIDAIADLPIECGDYVTSQVDDYRILMPTFKLFELAEDDGSRTTVEYICDDIIRHHEYDTDGVLLRKYHMLDDRRHGKYVEYNVNISTSQTRAPHERAHYLHNLLHGRREMWYQNGNLKSDIWYKYGTIHGEYRTYREDGTIKFEQYHHHGKAHGQQKVWYKSGKLSMITNYSYGLRDGPQVRWHKNGQICSFRMFKHDQYHGKCMIWCENGRPKKAMKYKHGKFHGRYKKWNDDGSVKYVRKYVGGLQID